jgi:hypothetical protein
LGLITYLILAEGSRSFSVRPQVRIYIFSNKQKMQTKEKNASGCFSYLLNPTACHQLGEMVFLKNTKPNRACITYHAIRHRYQEK